MEYHKTDSCLTKIWFSLLFHASVSPNWKTTALPQNSSLLTPNTEPSRFRNDFVRQVICFFVNSEWNQENTELGSLFIGKTCVNSNKQKQNYSKLK